MKPVVAIALVISLVGASLPAAAQPPSTSQLTNWGRVRTIVPGTRISVGIAGPDEVRQYFLDASDDDITLLDLTNRDLPRDARRTLLHIAQTRPGLFTARHWTEAADGHVRVNPDGVFVKGRRVAALEDIVRTIDRGDVGEVSRLRKARKQPERDLDVPPQGIMYGSALLASLVGASCAKCGNTAGLVLLFGTLLGPALVWTLVRNRHDRATEIVYRAP